MTEEPTPTQAAKTIDREHQIQIRLLQALAKGLDQGEEVSDLVDRLCEFSRAHFLSEELLMRLYAYPDYDDHVLDHERMVDWLEEIRTRQGDLAGRRHAVQELTAIFLRHIGSRDKRLHEFLEET